MQINIAQTLNKKPFELKKYSIKVITKKEKNDPNWSKFYRQKFKFTETSWGDRG